MTENTTPLMEHARALELAATRVHASMRKHTRDDASAAAHIATTLGHLHEVATELDAVHRELVALMRRDGCDWPLIGQLLNMTADEAQIRYS